MNRVNGITRKRNQYLLINVLKSDLSTEYSLSKVNINQTEIYNLQAFEFIAFHYC